MTKQQQQKQHQYQWRYTLTQFLYTIESEKKIAKIFTILLSQRQKIWKIFNRQQNGYGKWHTGIENKSYKFEKFYK